MYWKKLLFPRSSVALVQKVDSGRRGETALPLSCIARDLIKNMKGMLESNHKMMGAASLGKKREVK